MLCNTLGTSSSLKQPDKISSSRDTNEPIVLGSLIRFLQSLRLKIVSDFSSPMDRSTSISFMQSLSINFSRLEAVPRVLHNMKSLKVLNLDETAIYESRLGLSWLSIKRRKELGFFWTSLPCSLVKLSLESCGLFDEVMPNDFGSLPSLKSINLSRNPIRSIPESFSSLTNLDELLLTSCTELKVIPKLPVINPFIELQFSPSTFGLSSRQRLIYLKRCIIFGCEKLTEVEGVFKMEPIENFEVEHIKSLFNIDTIECNKVQLFNYLTDKKLVVKPQVF